MLTGGIDRLDEGLRLLSAGRAKKLFVSGVYRGVDVAALLRLARQAPGDLECCIMLGYAADNTAGNAHETAAWMKDQGLKTTMESAMANANYIKCNPDKVQKRMKEYPADALRELDVDKLHVVEARVDPGPKLKRWRPSSMRRPTRIVKPFSHLVIVLEEREPKLSKREKKKQRRREKTGEKKKAKLAEEKAPEPKKKAPELNKKVSEPKKKASQAKIKTQSTKNKPRKKKEKD